MNFGLQLFEVFQRGSIMVSLIRILLIFLIFMIFSQSVYSETITDETVLNLHKEYALKKTFGELKKYLSLNNFHEKSRFACNGRLQPFIYTNNSKNITVYVFCAGGLSNDSDIESIIPAPVQPIASQQGNLPVQPDNPVTPVTTQAKGSPSQFVMNLVKGYKNPCKGNCSNEFWTQYISYINKTNYSNDFIEVWKKTIIFQEPVLNADIIIERQEFCNTQAPNIIGESIIDNKRYQVEIIINFYICGGARANVRKRFVIVNENGWKIDDISFDKKTVKQEIMSAYDEIFAIKKSIPNRPYVELNSYMPNCPGHRPYNKCKAVASLGNNVTYSGEYVNDRPNGIGQLIEMDKKFSGQFRNGVLEGYQLVQFNNGMVLEAEFKNNKIVYGTQYWPDGRRYKGSFENDKINGFGMMIFPDGRRHFGDWKDGKPHGNGTQYSSTQVLLQNGLWEDGVFKTQIYVNPFPWR